MEINEPITLSGELLFCEEGNRLAQEFLNMARLAVETVGVVGAEYLRNSTSRTLEALIQHRGRCESCNKI